MVGIKLMIFHLFCLVSLILLVKAESSEDSYLAYEKPKSNSVFSSFREKVKKFFKLPDKFKGLGGRRKKNNGIAQTYIPPPYQNGHYYHQNKVLPEEYNKEHYSPYYTGPQYESGSNSVGKFSKEFYEARMPFYFPYHFHYDTKTEGYDGHHPGHYNHHDHQGDSNESIVIYKPKKVAPKSKKKDESEESSSSDVKKKKLNSKSSGEKINLSEKKPQKLEISKSESLIKKANKVVKKQPKENSKESKEKKKSKKKSRRPLKLKKLPSKLSSNESDKPKKSKRKRKANKNSESHEQDVSLEPQTLYKRFQKLAGVKKFFKYGGRPFRRQEYNDEGVIRIARSTKLRDNRDVDVITAPPLARQLNSREYLVGASMRATDKGVKRMKSKGIVLADKELNTGRRNGHTFQSETDDFNLMTMLKHIARSN